MAVYLTAQHFRDAAVRVRAVARVTPLIELPKAIGEAAAGPRMFGKCETMQPIGAFKIRGAYNMISLLPAAQRARGLLTYSSGNHGQAVAMAANIVKAPAVIVMPTTAPKPKVEGVRRFGAEIVFAGTTSTERRVKGEALAAERGLTIVPPYDHPDIIAGQGTAGLEILEQCSDVSIIYVPIGGGGLISGIAAAVKLTRPSVEIVGVEPVGAAAMGAALEAGEPVTLAHATSIADGLLADRAGDLTFPYARRYVDRCVTVSEDEIVRALLWLYRRAKLVVEPSGAVASAAMLREAAATKSAGRNVVAVLSGGNIAPELLCKLAETSPDA